MQDGSVGIRIVREKPKMQVWVPLVKVNEGGFQLITVLVPDPGESEVAPLPEAQQFVG